MNHLGIRTVATALMMFTIGCQPSEETPAPLSNTDTTAARRALVRDAVQKRYMDSAIASSLACRILAADPIRFDSIAGRTRYMLNGQDSCVLALIDAVADRFIATSERRYMVLFDSIANVGDGYVAEYIGAVSEKLFMEATDGYLDYVRSSRQREGLAEWLEIEWFFDMNSAANDDPAFVRIQHDADSLLEGRSASDRRFVEQIIERARQRAVDEYK